MGSQAWRLTAHLAGGITGTPYGEVDREKSRSGNYQARAKIMKASEAIVRV
jgi:hypothetical protein